MKKIVLKEEFNNEIIEEDMDSHYTMSAHMDMANEYVELARENYQVAIEAAESFSDYIYIIDEIIENLNDHQWANQLLHHAVRLMNEGDNIMAVIAKESLYKSEDEKDTIKKILEIVFKKCKTKRDFILCSMLIKNALGDEEWSNKVLKDSQEIE